MAGEHFAFQARRVITGVDKVGKSTVIADEVSTQRVAVDAFALCDIWESDKLPISMDAIPEVHDLKLYPPDSGFHFRLCCLPPDSEYDKEVAYESSLIAINAGGTFDGRSDVPGMHIHNTLDIVTVISGELHCVLETGEYALRQGDSIVMRGIMHSWSNKTDKPVIYSSMMVNGTNAG